ncbi:hypothetical protein [Pectobacterium brasiliense]|uniref:hypothetical protein n=1 Tax=Pectobacterium brasiliense TaxID=180957 RepID=UPI00196960F9|nr:hypothetical protein [Pectobacterium brasiliense]MBN3057967.1 hypothetical protein [Pectobacterium brasiliense]
MTVAIIRGEDDVYALLSKLINGEDSPSDLKVLFEGWPKFKIKLVGEQFQSTITPTVMKAFLELQAGIYRSYATACYGSPNATKLTREEREMLEMVVEVEPGSSKFNVDFGEILQNAVDGVVGKLESKHILIALLSFSVLYFGDSAYKNYLENRKDVRQAEIKSDEQRELLKHLTFTSKQETERALIIATAAAQNSRVHTISELSKDTKAEVLKRASSADKIELQGIQLTGYEAEELSKNARQQAIEIRLDGNYRILNVDSSDPSEFKVKVRSLENGDEFVATVQDLTVDMSHKLALQRGEWDRKSVRLTINAKQRPSDGTIYSAKVIQAVMGQ